LASCPYNLLIFCLYPKKISKKDKWIKRINGYPKRIKRIKRISKKDKKDKKDILFGYKKDKKYPFRIKKR
jgi:hypothetical protein